MNPSRAMSAIDHASYLLGLLCGVLLLALFAAAIWIAVRPAVRKHTRRFRLAILIAAAITVVKLALLHRLQGVNVDIMQFWTWGHAMAQLGPSHVYDPEFVCKYTPAYLYALWPAAAIAPDWPQYPRMLVESPAVLADFLLAITVYAATRLLASPRLALRTSMLAMLNPALFYSSTVWGQNDSAIGFPVLLSVVLAAESRYAFAWAIAIVAALIKAQGLMLLPILGWWTLINGKFSDWLKAAAVSVAVAIVVMAPFQLGRPWHFAIDVYSSSLGFFPWASLNAFNLMLALGGLVRLDSDRLFGPVSYFLLGNGLFASVYVLAAWMLWRRRTARELMFSVFVVYLGMFIFAPRMHERYLYYAVALLTPLAFESVTTLALYAILSVTSLLDMAYVFFDMVYAKGVVEGHLIIGPNGRFVIALVNIAAFALAAAYGLAAYRNVDRRAQPAEAHQERAA